MQAQGESACVRPLRPKYGCSWNDKKGRVAATHKKPLSDVCVCTLTLSFRNIFLNLMSELRLDLCVHVCVCLCMCEREKVCVSVCVWMKPFARWEFVKWENISRQMHLWEVLREILQPFQVLGVVLDLPLSCGHPNLNGLTVNFSVKGVMQLETELPLEKSF